MQLDAWVGFQLFGLAIDVEFNLPRHCVSIAAVAAETAGIHRCEFVAAADRHVNSPD